MNVRWATAIQQGRNRRNNLVVEIDGVKHCVSEWVEMSGVCYPTLQSRIRAGITGVDLLKTP
jgi:hypothetical protein